MKLNKYLIISSKGKTRITQNPPRLDFDEIVVQLDISIPDALFQKPFLEATIEIPEFTFPKLISSDVVENVQEAVRQSTGLAFEIKVVYPELIDSEEESTNGDDGD